MRQHAIRFALPLVLLAVAGVGVAMAASASTRSTATVDTAKTKYGNVLVSAKHATLYRYTKDRKGVNTCTGPTCAPYWPALLVAASAKPTAGPGVEAALLGTIKAAHGMRQVTYAGYPLYTYVGDTKAGATKGQGFEGTWYVVNAKGALVKHAVAGGGSNSSGTGTTTSGGGGSAWG